MAIYTAHRDDDGFVTVEMTTPVERTITISRELVEQECALGFFMSRDRNTITMHTRDGDWTYRLVGYNPATEEYRAELIKPATSPWVFSSDSMLTPNQVRHVLGLDQDGR